MIAFRRLIVATVVATGTMSAVITRASAYPQWQVGGGAGRCNLCHLAPTGGGLLSDEGRRAVGRDLSTFSGEGALLYGAGPLPTWLAIGADLRSSYQEHDFQDPSSASDAFSPLQAEVQADLSLGGLSAYGTVGTRGDWWTPDEPVPTQNYHAVTASHVVSREHWLLWQEDGRGGTGVYVRAGRYFAPFGLQLAQSFIYTRRELGFDQLQESYNLSAGYMQRGWELHATGFAPDVVRHFGSEERGAGVHVELRAFARRLALTADARYAARTGSERWLAALSVKLHLAPLRTTFLVEADAVRLSVDGFAARGQTVALLGAEVAPVRGLTIMGLAEWFQEDVAIRDAARGAATVVVGWLPYAHFEAQIVARAELPTGGDVAKTLLAQLHCFL